MYNTDLLPQDIVEHEGFKYMMDVLEGRTIAGQLLKWACERQFNDLHHAHERGFYFSSDMADIMLDTIREYKHYKGALAGTYFEPTPPQIFLNWVLFGWLQVETGKRRFQELYYEVARKNGKTFQGASTGCYMFEADGEAGAECYTIATKLKQARIAHEDAKAIVSKTPFLRQKVKTLRDNMSISATNSKFEPLGKESKTEDGLNPHFALVDEYHAHKDAGMYDVIDSALAGREQPLVYIITTAGVNLQGPCFKHREYMEKILNPDIDVENDSVLPLIYTLDKDDDPFDESVWEKANPNMPYIPTILPRLRTKALAAKGNPATLVNFKTKHLNIWCASSSPWLDMEKWYLSDGTFGRRDLINRTCYTGLDLATTDDLAALVHVFPPEQESIASQRKKYRDEVIAEIKKVHKDLTDQAFIFVLEEKEEDIELDLNKRDYIIPDPYQIIPHFFVPKENIEIRSKEHGVNYNLWKKDKSCNFHATPGEITDYNWIEHQIDKDNTLYNIAELAFDPYNSTGIINNLMDKDYECVRISQTWENFSWVTKEFEQLVNLQLLAHNNNPVLSWNASNVVVHIGPGGAYKPDKRKSKEKIDGIIALLMGLNRAIMHEKPSEEEQEGNDGSLLNIEV
ncbi:MAG: terminase large subunit [Desulfobacterales bacterium]|nr:terminase large subunit [Desulfobacterales bacterium]